MALTLLSPRSQPARRPLCIALNISLIAAFFRMILGDFGEPRGSVISRVLLEQTPVGEQQNIRLLARESLRRSLTRSWLLVLFSPSTHDLTMLWGGVGLRDRCVTLESSDMVFFLSSCVFLVLKKVCPDYRCNWSTSLLKSCPSCGLTLSVPRCSGLRHFTETYRIV